MVPGHYQISRVVLYDDRLVRCNAGHLVARRTWMSSVTLCFTTTFSDAAQALPLPYSASGGKPPVHLLPQSPGCCQLDFPKRQQDRHTLSLSNVARSIGFYSDNFQTLAALSLTQIGLVVPQHRHEST
ncbi:hypothetical protein CLAIMM_02481 [Cladophialophora immunda]|nr:hypothetical protein CLAIMM_02481 [Cladophialophora immunda]